MSAMERIVDFAPHIADGAYLVRMEPRGRSEDSIFAKFVCDWQAQAIETFRQGKTNTERELRAELVKRVIALTGREVPANLVYADPDKHTARVTVDGVSFRLIRDQLVMLLPCAYCGVREFESLPIQSQADLGRALSEWKPYCHDCTPEDPDEWE
jgi:hypothetical protein